jgi:hypothetical protein
MRAPAGRLHPFPPGPLDLLRQAALDQRLHHGFVSPSEEANKEQVVGFVEPPRTAWGLSAARVPRPRAVQARCSQDYCA